jgi:hypothetical protein
MLKTILITSAIALAAVAVAHRIPAAKKLLTGV